MLKMPPGCLEQHLNILLWRFFFQDVVFIPQNLRFIPQIWNVLNFLLQLYRGKLENGTLVAIRCLVLSKKYSVQNLKVRLDVLSKLHHPHLVGLFGHCMEGDGHDNSNVNQVLLVYEYVSNRNYRTLLSG